MFGISGKLPIKVICLDESLKHEMLEKTPQTPLLSAILSDKPAKIEAIKILLERGADPNRVGDARVSYFIRLFSLRKFVEFPKQEQKEILELLVEYGATPDSRLNAMRCTDFHIIACRHLDSYYPKERQEIVDLLVEVGCDFRLKTRDDESVLDFAMSQGVIDSFIKHMTPADFVCLQKCKRKPHPRSLWALRSEITPQDFEEFLINFSLHRDADETVIKLLIHLTGCDGTNEILDRVISRAFEIYMFPARHNFIYLSFYLKNGQEMREKYSLNADLLKYIESCDNSAKMWKNSIFGHEKVIVI